MKVSIERLKDYVTIWMAPSVLISLCFLMTPTLMAADTIHLKNGTTIEAEIVEETDSHVKANFRGGILTYQRENIERIEREVPEPVTDSSFMDPSEIFERIAPSVVVITAHKENQQIGQGSGFIGGSNGKIVTACHVIDGANDIMVRLKDGSTFQVTEIIDYDLLNDICVLKVETTGLNPVPLAESDSLKVGQQLFIISSPLGHDYTLAEGLLSGIRYAQYRRELQFTVPISSGSSGAALLDSAGEVIGIAIRIAVGGQNLNFAAPIVDIRPLLETSVKGAQKDAIKKKLHAISLVRQSAQPYSQGDIQGEIRLLEEALSVDPESSDIHLLLSVKYGFNLPNSLETLNTAIRLGKEVIRLRPSNVFAHTNMGSWHLKRSNFMGESQAEEDLKKAEEYFNAALKLNPHIIGAYAGLAGIYLPKGDYELTKTYAQKELEVQPNSARALAILGFVYEQEGKFKEAVRYFENALRMDTEGDVDPDLIHGMLSRIHLQAGDEKSALSELAKVRNPGIIAELKGLFPTGTRFESLELSTPSIFSAQEANPVQVDERLLQYEMIGHTAVPLVDTVFITNASQKDLEGYAKWSIQEAEAMQASDGKARLKAAKRLFEICRKKGGNCIQEFSVLHDAVGYLVNQQLVTKSYERASKYAKECVGFIESSGGVEFLLSKSGDLLKRLGSDANEIELGLAVVLESYSACYELVASYYAVRDDGVNLLRYLNKMKRFNAPPKYISELEQSMQDPAMLQVIKDEWGTSKKGWFW